MRMTQADADRHNAKFAPKPSQAKAHDGLESILHEQIAAECRRRRFYFVHSRTDKRTTTQLGVPDFIIAMPNGRTLWVEVKRKGGKLSPEQNVTRHVLTALDQDYKLIYSFGEFLEAVNL